MKSKKYQIDRKSEYIKLLLIQDELSFFDKALSEAVSNESTWLNKLRATRLVFLTLNNVKDAADKFSIKDNAPLTAKTRDIKRRLCFSKHFRNLRVGHFNANLLERTAQWMPHIFFESSRSNELAQTIESQRGVIESCINSHSNIVSQEFKTEIDLYYPPDANLFYTYLYECTQSALDWLSSAKSAISNEINFHSKEEIFELSSVAGQTNFNLGEESDLNYSRQDAKRSIYEVVKYLQKEKANDEICEVLNKL